MNLLRSLSARHLRLNRKRTLITIIGIALSVTMVTAISGFIASMQDLMYQDAINREGLWHVRYFALDETTAAAVAAEPVFASHTQTKTEDGITLELLFETLDRHLFDRSEEVCFRHGIDEYQVQYHTNLLIAEGIVPSGYYQSIYSFAAILLALVVVASVMVISNAFSISASERSRQFGLLKSVGATGKQVRKIVLWEGAILGLYAIPLGIVLGIAAQWVVLTVANYILSITEAVNMTAQFRVVVTPWVLLVAVAAAFATIFLAAWRPARRASRQSAIDAIRQTSEVKVRHRDVRVSPLVAKLFGFEGALAAKTMKRNRRRYRTTTISLVVSIVLFIGVSSFGQILFKATSMVYEDHGSNVYIRIHGEDEARQRRLADEISALKNVKTHSFRELLGEVNVQPDWMTATGLKMLESGGKPVKLYSLSDSDYAALCKAARLDPAAPEPPGQTGAILINTSGTYIRQGRRHNFSPYQSLKGQSFPITLEGNSHAVTVMGEVHEIPAAIRLFYTANALNLVVSESTRAALQPADSPSDLVITAMANDADAFEAQATALLTAEAIETQFGIMNYDAMVENSRNISLLVMIFVYGFIAMLSLISVTNVVTTISTSIALRKRELATLRSVGMTGGDITKSLRYESLIYSAKSLLLGIPLGLAASYAMYCAMGGSMSFAYIWPVQSMLISAAAVLLLTMLTMGFANKRQQCDSIADVLQSEIA